MNAKNQMIKQSKTGYVVRWTDSNSAQLVKFGTNFYGGFVVTPNMDMDKIISGAGTIEMVIREIAKMGYGKNLHK